MKIFNIIKHLFILLLFCGIAINATAANEHLYRTDRLSSNLFNDITQDSIGYIWVATEYGLNKFDGTESQHFFADGKNGSLMSNNVRCLRVAPDGTLFLATDYGLQKYDPIKMCFVEVSGIDGLSVKVADMVIDGNTLIALTFSGSIMQYDAVLGKLIEKDKISSKLPKDVRGRHIFIDNLHNYWIGTSKKGIFRIDRRGNVVKHYTDPGIDKAIISGIVSTKDGTVYVVTSGGVWRYDKKNDRFSAIPMTPNYPSIRKIYVSNDDIPLVCTYGRGLYYIDVVENVCKPVSIKTGTVLPLETTNVTAIYQDKDRNMWIGCLYDGLFLLPHKPSCFETVNIFDFQGSNSRALTMIDVVEDSGIWVGQERNGLFKVDSSGNILGRYMETHTPLCIERDNTGRLRVGLYDHGVAIIDPASGKVEYDKRFGYKRIKSIIRTGDGVMYYAVFNDGLYKSSPDDTKLSPITSVKHKSINKLYLDSDSLLWLGHYNGVECYDPRTDKSVPLPTNEDLTKTACYAIIEHNGSMYFGTADGMYVYDKEKKTYFHYSVADGMSNEVICGLAEDDHGNLWLSTFRGLTKFNPNDKSATPFFIEEGLENTMYQRSIYTQDSDGSIYFGNGHSYIRFLPSGINEGLMKKDLLLTRFVIHCNATNESLERNYSADIPVEKIKRFKLSHTEDSFTMYFSTLNYGESETMQLQYRFKDSERWYSTEPGDMKVNFTRLPSGIWNLEFRAVNNGYISETLKLIVEVSPPWYISNLAIMIYVVLIVSTGLWLLRMWLQRQRDANNEAKLRFFIDIAHEFRSPITLMLSPLQSLLKKENDPQTARALRSMYRNASRMMQLLNQILDIRKIDKGQMKIKCLPTDIVKFTKEVCHVFDYEADNRKCSLSFESTVETVQAWIDRNHFDKVLYNLLSNAFKFVPDKGSIDVSIVVDPLPRSGFPEGSVNISVTDSGPGIDEQKMKQIFDRFYQISPRSGNGTSGYGIGLNLSRQLVELHHGIIKVENRSDGVSGSRFTVFIPLGNRLLHQDQISTESESEATPVHTLQPVIPNSDSDKLKYVPKKTNFHVVIVDDDAEIRNYLRTEFHPFYHTKVCDNGKDALKLIMKERPDLVISDIVMPEMDGYELLRRIKTCSDTSYIPVILLTSKTDISEKISGLRKGADAYIEKPFNIEELLVSVSSLIANRRLVKGNYSGAQEQKERVEKVVMKDVDDELMESIMEILNANVDNSELNVEMLANKVGISRAQLHRRMKDITGIACGEFIRNFRLKHAAELLCSGGNVYVAQIAYACGFSSPTNFSTTFKKHYGMSPSEYAEAHLNENITNHETKNNEDETSA